MLAWGLFCGWAYTYALWIFTSPASLGLFGEIPRTLMHPLSLFLGIVFAALLPQSDCRVAARVCGALLLCAVGAYLLLPSARLALSCVITALLGPMGTALMMPYVYLLNNCEKLYSLLLTGVVLAPLGLLYQSGWLRGMRELLVCFFVLLAALLPTLWFRQTAPERPDDLPSPTRITYFSLWLNFAFAAAVLGGGLLVLSRIARESPAAHYSMEYIGILLGGLIYLAVFAALRDSLRVTWPVTFSAFFLAMFLHALWSESRTLSMTSALLIGLSMAVGLLNMFYNFGVVGKEFRMRAHMVETLGFAFIGSSLCVVIARTAPTLASESVAVGAMIASALVLVGYFVSAPILNRSYFAEDWVTDSEYAEVGMAAQARREREAQKATPELVEKLFEDFITRAHTLTPTELVVFRYYTQGKTAEEILALMFIAPGTLKNHNTHMFRKLQVSSRDELMVYIDLLRKCEMLETLFSAKVDGDK